MQFHSPNISTLLFGFIFLYVGFHLFYKKVQVMKKCKEETYGRVIDSVRSGIPDKHRPKQQYASIYEYYVHGQPYHHRSNLISTKKDPLGKQVTIRYNQEDPNIVYIKEETRTNFYLSSVFFLFGLLIVFLSFVSTENL